jgi:hypothetical protein
LANLWIDLCEVVRPKRLGRRGAAALEVRSCKRNSRCQDCVHERKSCGPSGAAVEYRKRSVTTGARERPEEDSRDLKKPL